MVACGRGRVIRPVHALILVAAAIGVYYAAKLATDDEYSLDDLGEYLDLSGAGEVFDGIFESVGSVVDSVGGFINVGFENVYGETFGYWDMKPSPQILNYLVKEESKSYVAYEAKGKGKGDWTIGVGHKLMGEELKTLIGVALNDNQIADLLYGDINRRAGAPLFREGAASFVRRLLSFEASQDQFDALVCMAFNTPQGAKGAIDLHNKGKFSETANYIQNYENKAVAPWSKYGGLKTRRKFEADLYRRGITG